MMYKLGDIVTLEYGKPVNDKARKNGKYPVFGTNGQIGTSNLDPLCGFPSVIIGRKGAYRGVHYSKVPFSVIDTAFYVKPKHNELDMKWVYYKFKTFDINSMDSGSAIPSTDRYELYALDITVPPVPEQRAIAATLSCLDDKIELNNRMNKTLEEMAQAIFKSWFVDFEPFQDGEFVDSELGRIPKGWRVGTLGEFFPIITGKKNANIALEKGTYPFFSCSQTISYTDDFSFDANAILVAGNGDFNVKSYNGKFEAYQRTYVLIPYDKSLVGFLYYAMKYFLNDITSGYRGSVIKFITKSNLQDYKLALPPSFSNIEVITTMQSILSSIAEIERQTQMLVKIRDSILPKLISGEICVPLEA